VLLTQPVQVEPSLCFRTLGKFERHDLPLRRQVFEQRIERAAAEVETGLERLFDADVEPGLDALGHELDRNGIDQYPGQNRHQAEHEHQAQLET